MHVGAVFLKFTNLSRNKMTGGCGGLYSNLCLLSDVWCSGLFLGLEYKYYSGPGPGPSVATASLEGVFFRCNCASVYFKILNLRVSKI